MTTVEYFQKMLNKHLINYEHELNRGVPEEILINIQFKIDCCKAAIDSLIGVNGQSHWEEVETVAFVGINSDGTARMAKRKYFRCSRCGRCSAIKEEFCPKCGRRVV